MWSIRQIRVPAKAAQAGKERQGRKDDDWRNFPLPAAAKSKFPTHGWNGSIRGRIINTLVLGLWVCGLGLGAWLYVGPGQWRKVRLAASLNLIYKLAISTKSLCSSWRRSQRWEIRWLRQSCMARVTASPMRWHHTRNCIKWRPVAKMAVHKHPDFLCFFHFRFVAAGHNLQSQRKTPNICIFL